MTTRRSLTACGVALWACVGCNGGVVGVDRASLEQGDEAELDFPTWEVEDVAIEPLAELSIDWVKRLPGPDQALGSGISAGYFRVLQADHDGKLALFYKDDSTQSLELARLNDKGDVEQAVEVARPEDWKDGDDTQVGFGSCGSTTCVNDAIALKASWWKADDPKNESWRMEKLVFADDITQPPKRKSLTNGVIDDLVQSPAGDVYSITSDPGHFIQKRDAGGRSLWKAEHIEEGSMFGKNSPDAGRRLTLTAVPLDDGRLVVVTQPDESLRCYVTFFDADGKRTNTQTFLNNTRYLLNGGDRAVSVSSYDTNGDLLVLGLIDSSHNKGVRFVREDYTLLYPEAAGIDPAGNVYIGTHNGGRLNAKPTLCRAAASGGGECYLMPIQAEAGSEEFRFDEIVARDDGELYIHSGFDLIHLRYPK